MRTAFRMRAASGQHALALDRLPALEKTVGNLHKQGQQHSAAVASMSDEAFGEALEQMARDVHEDIHPTLAAHQLFSGHATR